MNHPKRGWRRTLLSLAALAALASPAISSGCGGGFSAISKIDGLRVLAVVVDKPYANPGDDVTFSMTYYDGFVDPADPTAPARNVQVVWLGGCFNPPGDTYYGCYQSLGAVLGSLKTGDKPPPGTFGIGPTFTTTLPGDIISSRALPLAGPRYGIGYVFFAACAGTVKPVPPDSSGNAGAFPIGCFDADGNRLGADSFVPGYTQVYAFEDGRTNANPTDPSTSGKAAPNVKALTLDGKPMLEGPENAVSVKRCAVDEDTRNAPPSCSSKDPFSACTSVTLDVDVTADVAEVEVDPDSVGPTGKPLHEVVWVDYFAEKGDFDSDVRLVSDATTGLTPEHSSKWIAPPEPGLVSVWAVVRDARGGTDVLLRYLRVE